MSPVRFEWDVESQRIDRSDGEDPQAKRRRRRNMLLLLCLLSLLLALGTGAVVFIRQRQIDLENYFAQLLQDTVKAEVAALRIGDINTFLNIQSTSDDDWLKQQREQFQEYSVLKAAGAIELSGNILDVAIDGERARVTVQEDIRDLPYARLWFYRRTENGWQHSPPDYSFWGEAEQYQVAEVSVNYRAVDSELARQLGDTTAEWLRQGCAILDCGDLPPLTIDILSGAAETAAWADDRLMRLVIASPYVDLVLADMPFDSERRSQVGQLLAERLVNQHLNYLGTAYPHDAYFMRVATIAWLTERFTGVERGALLMGSLADNYGDDKVGQLLSLLAVDSDMSVIAELLPLPLVEAELDWRDFIEWRLQTEAELISARAEIEWQSFYDMSVESVRLAAYDNYNRNAPSRYYHVTEQMPSISEAGQAQLSVTVEHVAGEQNEEQIILFNLVSNVWKRAS